MVHVSHLLLTADMLDLLDRSSGTEFLEETSRPKCSNSHRKCLLFLFVSITFLALAVAYLYYFGPSLFFKFQRETETEMLKVEEIKPKFLLPTDVKPIHYRLRLHPNLETFTYSGRVSIQILCTNQTSKIILHADTINVTNINLSLTKRENIVSFDRLKRAVSPNLFVSKTTQIPFKSVLFENDKLILSLYEDLELNQAYLLDIKFLGEISNDLIGFYKSSYHDNLGRKKWIATTHFQPIYARKVFPCFDEPKFKTNFEISIARRTNTTTLSNMPLKETEPINNWSSWVWDHYQTSPLMSTYLVAFTISDMKSVNVTWKMSGPVVKIWAAKQDLDKTKFAVESTKQILSFYESYFKVKYALPKLDLIAIPRFAKGAMENWGVISFRDSSLLLDNSTDGFESRKHVFNTIAHELAHQWFGNLVTMAWWSDLWLNEGFATYMASLAESEIHPNWDSATNFAVDITHKALKFDLPNLSHSLHTVLVSDSDIERIFDPIMYDKAAALLRMVNCTIGEEAFKIGVQNYLQKWSYNSTSEESLWGSFNVLPVNLSLNSLMSGWSRQVGYPLVSVVRLNGSFEIVQNKFLENESGDSWVLPLTYLVKDGETKFSFVKEKMTRLDLNVMDGSWILLNVNQTGFYRVNYDQKNWRLLIEQLEVDFEEIPVASRAQLIGDAFELARNDLLDYEIPFKILKYLKHDLSFSPWKTAFNSLDFLENIFIDTQNYFHFMDFMLRLMYKIVNKLSGSQNPLSLLIESKLCRYRYKPCVEKALDAFEDFKNSKKQISYNFKQTALCTAIEMGTEPHWEFVWNKTLSKNISGTELRTLYLSLGCSKDTILLYRYLKETLNGNVAVQNVMYVWRSLGKHAIGRLIGFKFLENNWKKIYETYKGNVNVLQGIIEEFLFSLSSTSDLEKVTQFYLEYEENLDGVAGLIKTAIQSIKMKVAWREKHLDEVMKYL